MQAPGGAEEPGVADGEDAAVGGDQPVAAAGQVCGHPDDRPVEGQVPGGPMEHGVAESEDAAIGGDQPVAPVVRCCRHPDDGLVERQVPGGPMEDGVAEGEDAAVGGDQPVAATVRRGRHRDDGLVESQASGGAEEPGVAEGEDAAIGGDQPVSPVVWGGGHRDDGPVEGHTAGGAEEPCVAKGEDAAVRPHQPVAGQCIGVPVGADRLARAEGGRDDDVDRAARCRTLRNCGNDRPRCRQSEDRRDAAERHDRRPTEARSRDCHCSPAADRALVGDHGGDLGSEVGEGGRGDSGTGAGSVRPSRRDRDRRRAWRTRRGAHGH